MTDKQIIFDDVDVKDCIAYAKSQTVYFGNTLYNQAENICMVKNQPCKFFDCQFKQMARELKAKEQECERLKELNTRLDNQREVYWKEYQKHKQAIEKVREACGVSLCGDDTRSLILEICDEVNDETTNN